MIEKLLITDNSNSPISYIRNLDNFKNGTEYKFKPGINIIVGENGCGKSTLLKLLKAYLLVDSVECGKGSYNNNINRLFNGNNSLKDGVEVFADYTKNTFRLCHVEEKGEEETLKTFESFGTYATQVRSSTGEGVLISISSLFSYIFSDKVSLNFDYSSQFMDNYKEYVEYTDKHRISCEDEWTILMDEPDRNLSINNINDIKDILNYHKENTQIIAVIHNPLLIYALSKNNEINFIELTSGYIDKINQIINEL